MANSYINTYTQLHIQFIFAVKFRQALISAEWKQELHKYITGVIQNKTHKMIQINTMPDHLHMLIGYKPVDHMSDMIRVVKNANRDFINENRLTKYRFEWQDGYGAFSYAKKDIPNVANYIETQEQHHRIKSFHEEYISFLNEFGIEYDNKYLFKPLIE